MGDYERAIVAASYWLDASPHERTEGDGLVLAQAVRDLLDELAEANTLLKQEQEECGKHLDEKCKLRFELNRAEAELAELRGKHWNQSADIVSVRAELVEAKDYCIDILQVIAPQVEPLDTVVGLISQLDNISAGWKAERDRLREGHKRIEKIVGEQKDTIVGLQGYATGLREALEKLIEGGQQ